jgi:hypothetical protein
MPYEHQLKMLVDGFENTSHDFAKWAEALDVRAAAIGGQLFAGRGARHISPPPNNRQAYKALSVSLQNVATLLSDIADCQEGMVNHVSMALGLALPLGVPNSAEITMGRALTESELLHLILDWQQMDLGTFKTFMRLYGLTPGDQPTRHSPGATSDQRLAEEIVSWLTVISADVNLFINQQNFPKGGPHPPPAAATVHDALVNIEQQYHRLVNNYLVLLTVLPYHLKRANP